MRIVVDTNVVVSALLKAGSVPARALARVLRDAAVLYDRRVLMEYESVLDRPKLGVSEAQARELLEQIVRSGSLVDGPARWMGPMPDESDRPFVEIALAGRADILMTGNLRDFPLDLGFEVLPPALVLARLEDG